MTAKITKLLVDIDNENLVVSATSSGADTKDGVTYHHQFYKLDIDSTSTFNCKNEPSTLATSIPLVCDQDTNLVDYPISFNDILCSDIPNDILFAWLYEKEYVIREWNLGLVVDESEPELAMYIYITDGTDIYKCKLTDLDDGVVMTKVDSMPGTGSDDYKVDCIIHGEGKYLYFKVTYNEEISYYRMNITSKAVQIVDASKFPTSVNDYYADNVLFGVTLSVKNFYNLLLNHIDIVSDDNPCTCNVECSDVNFMLAWDGFNLAKTLQDYRQMIKYWRILHRAGNSTTSNCGCNK